jgi:hypothetical protein
MEDVIPTPFELTEAEMDLVVGGSNVYIGSNSSQINQSINHVALSNPAQISMGNNNIGISGNIVRSH